MQSTSTADRARKEQSSGWSPQRRNLVGACLAHLLFLPFLIHAKGGGEATIGIGLALLFGGAPWVRRAAAGSASSSALFGA